MARGPTHNAQTVIDAIQKTGGIKSRIAKALGVSRQTVDNYLNRWPTVRTAYNAEVARIGDLAEDRMIAKIDAGFWPAIQFYLKTKCKNRGYVERQELTGADGESLDVKLNWGDSANPND
jgi:IS30 family transposase